MAQPSLKIDRARYVLTVDPQRRIIRDGSIVIERGRIVRVGKADELADASADRVIDAREFVVTPGFVNGHMHISYAHPVRGIFPDDLGSPLKHVFALQMAMTEEEEYQTSLLALLELVRNGTVCLVDPGSTKFPDACLQAYEDAGVRVILGEAVTDRDAPFPQPRFTTAEAAARTAAFIDKWNGRLEGRLRAWAMPFSPETCSAELLQALTRVVRERRAGAEGLPGPRSKQSDRVPREARRARPERASRARPRHRCRRDRLHCTDGHGRHDVPGHGGQGRPRCRRAGANA